MDTYCILVACTYLEVSLPASAEQTADVSALWALRGHSERTFTNTVLLLSQEVTQWFAEDMPPYLQQYAAALGQDKGSVVARWTDAASALVAFVAELT